MSHALKCDSCGVYYDEYNGPANRIIVRNHDYRYNNYDDIAKVDLCQCCAQKLRNFLNIDSGQSK